MLSLPIPQSPGGGGNVDIRDCFNSFTDSEVLSGDNAWTCPRCKVPRTSEKVLSIARLPSLLIVHLKRFRFDGRWRDKIDSLVTCPIYDLDLCSGRAAAIRSDLYDLYGVCNHYGNLNGGHCKSALSI